MISFDLDLSQAPEDVEFSSLMVCGTKMLLKKKPGFDPKPPQAQATPPKPVDELHRMVGDREKEIEEIRRSLSWRLTAPLRSAGAFLSRALGRSRR